MTRTGMTCCEAQIDKRAGQSRFQRSTATVTKWARKTHNPSVVGSRPICPTMSDLRVPESTQRVRPRSVRRKAAARGG